MLQNIINRFECFQTLSVSKNFNSQELTVLGKILLEGARQVEVANVIRFPSIERGFSIFSVESGSSLATVVTTEEQADGTRSASATKQEQILPRLSSGLISDLKNDAYHLIVRQGDSLQHGMVLASFTNMQTAALALRKLAKLNARKSRFWKILGVLFVLYLILSIPMLKRSQTKGLSEISSSMESRNPEIARQVDAINRSRTVGSELMADPTQNTVMAQPDPNTMLGGQAAAVEPQSAPVSAPKAEASQGNFGF